MMVKSCCSVVCSRVLFFFFSSRRRHTRLVSDWSSDVCSSDLNHYAIVIGGRLAGLLTARVLADHFSHVTIIERDLFTADPRPRPGVPQSRHIHALLPRGLRIVEGLFPRIRHELEAAGAVPLDIGNDVAWLTPEGW